MKKSNEPNQPKGPMDKAPIKEPPNESPNADQPDHRKEYL